jgi:hypothetical protein
MRTRILALDDQKYLHEMIAEILDDAGYSRGRALLTC